MCCALSSGSKTANGRPCVAQRSAWRGCFRLQPDGEDPAPNERELREAGARGRGGGPGEDEPATVSHELRTPLNAIRLSGGPEIGNVRPARPTATVPMDVFTSGTHLLEIINDILDLSKVAAGKFELMEQAFDIDHAVDSCAQLMRDWATTAKLCRCIPIFPPIYRSSTGMNCA